MNPTYEVRSRKFDSLLEASYHAVSIYVNPPGIRMMVDDADGEGRHQGAYYVYNETTGMYQEVEQVS
jgi:hypothetical protein